MKLYPKPNVPEDQAGLTAEEIRRGLHWLQVDVKCEDCGKEQSVAAAGSTDRGRCVKCGGRTS